MRRDRRRPMPRITGAGRALRAIAAHPSLWLAAVNATRRLVPRRWWLRPPFLPVPHRDYVRFRHMTALGGDGSLPAEPDDLIQWLEWCRRWPRVAVA